MGVLFKSTRSAKKQLLCRQYNLQKSHIDEFLDRLAICLDNGIVENKEIILMADLNISQLSTNECEKLESNFLQYVTSPINNCTPRRFLIIQVLII